MMEKSKNFKDIEERVTNLEAFCRDMDAKLDHIIKRLDKNGDGHCNNDFRG